MLTKENFSIPYCINHRASHLSSSFKLITSVFIPEHKTPIYPKIKDVNFISRTSGSKTYINLTNIKTKITVDLNRYRTHLYQIQI